MRTQREETFYHRVMALQKAIAIESAGAVSTFEASRFQRKKKRRLGEISKLGLKSRVRFID